MYYNSVFKDNEEKHLREWIEIIITHTGSSLALHSFRVFTAAHWVQLSV